MLKSQKNNEKVYALAFDFMQNISLPCIPVQEIFYLRQLSVYPFGIHNLKDDSSMIFLYHEGKAHKGPDEVCLFLLKYINENIPSSVEELHLYSDGCGGQNKNNHVIRFLLALTDTGRFKKIIYRLPIRGHSFLPCDRDFGLIKKVLRKTDRYYDLKQLTSMICSASKIPNKFSVYLVNRNDILDIKTWWKLLYKKSTFSLESQRLKTGKKEPFNVSFYRQFEFNADKKGVVIVGKFVNGFVKKTFKFGKENSLISLPSA